MDTVCPATQTSGRVGSSRLGTDWVLYTHRLTYGFVGQVERYGGGFCGVTDLQGGQRLGKLDRVQTVQGDEQNQNCANSRGCYYSGLDSSVTEHSCTGQFSPPCSQSSPWVYQLANGRGLGVDGGGVRTLLQELNWIASGTTNIKKLELS